MPKDKKRVKIGMFQIDEILKLKAPGVRGPTVVELLLQQCRHSGEMGPEPAYLFEIDGSYVDVYEVEGEPMSVEVCYADDKDTLGREAQQEKEGKAVKKSQRIWKAFDERDRSICTVTTVQRDDEDDVVFYRRACEEVTRQLNRPGRRTCYRRWLEGGKRLMFQPEGAPEERKRGFLTPLGKPPQ